MIIDSLGLPKDVGASDKMDSARLAGLMVTFGHWMPDRTKIAQYVVNGQGVRHPEEFPANNPKNFTRDQMTCLVGGLATIGYTDLVKQLLDGAIARGNRAQNTEADVPGSIKKFPDGADLLSPSVMNHLKICAGEKPKLLGKINLVIDILYRGVFAPKSEPNQLLVMCKMAGPFYMKLLKLTNLRLADSLREYWGGWRGEPSLAEFIIKNM